MNFELTDEQRMLQDTLRRMLASSQGSAWQPLAEQGVFAALFSEQYGGLGGSGFDIAVVFEELGRAATIDPVLDSALLCGRLIAEVASETHSELHANIVSGEVQLAFAHTEPASRYALVHVETTIEQRAQQQVLNGQKSVVVNARCAEYLLVSARDEAADDHNGIALYLVPANSSGISMYHYEMSGGGQAAEVTFENVAVSSADCLSADALPAIESAVAAAVVAQCADTLGAMETVMSMTTDYLGTRQQFGRPLATFQALSHRVADMLIELEQARSAVILAAGHLDADPVTRDLYGSAAKNLVGRVGQLIAEESIQLHGGIGMTDEYQLGKYARRIIMADHRFGDVDYHLERFMELGKTHGDF